MLCASVSLPTWCGADVYHVQNGVSLRAKCWANCNEPGGPIDVLCYCLFEISLLTFLVEESRCVSISSNYISISELVQHTPYLYSYSILRFQ